MELLDGTLCDAAIVVIDECKAARPASLSIRGDHDLHGVADSAEVLPNVYFGRAVREIPDE
jgi:hypothetical protein